MAGELTVWLRRLQGGDAGALDQVVRILYDELRAVARGRLRSEREGHTLSATALVNEAYLRLAHEHRLPADSRTQFLAVASNVMRRVLVDYARARSRIKRGSGAERVPLEDVEPFLTDAEADEVLALEAGLIRLAEASPRAAQVVELRFFSGLTVSEISEHLGLSEKTVQRDWAAARAWLRKEIGSGGGLAG
jgi:RNA polymerase sigma factor (TIGR02999 family)